MFRSLLLTCALVWGFTADVLAHAADTLQQQVPPPAPALRVSLCLAGLPNSQARPDSPVFFTVQTDVYRGDSLYIAAGSRAKGRITLTCTLDAHPCFVFLPEAVQTTEGDMKPLQPTFVRIGATLQDPAAWQQPFLVLLEEGSIANGEAP